MKTGTITERHLVFFHGGGKFLPDSRIPLLLNLLRSGPIIISLLTDNEPVSLSVYLLSPKTSTSHGGASEDGKEEAQAGKQHFQGEVN